MTFDNRLPLRSNLNQFSPVNGRDGVSAYATVLAPFTVPAIGSSVQVEFDHTVWMVPGQHLYMQDVGTFSVASVDGPNVATLTNVQATAGSVARGLKVAPSGIPGTSASATPTLIAALNTLKPTASRQVVWVDGFASVGDGGEGTFVWDAAYIGSGDGYNGIGGTIVVPSYAGYTTGAWRRVREKGWLNAAHFGAFPTPKGSPIDVYPILQHIIDLNNELGGEGLYLPETPVKQVGLNDEAGCYYMISQPLVINEGATGTVSGGTSAVTLTNGSATIAFLNAQTFVAGTRFTFGAQGGVVYTLASTITAATSATLTAPYTGTSGASAANVQGNFTNRIRGQERMSVILTPLRASGDVRSGFSSFIGDLVLAGRWDATPPTYTSQTYRALATTVMKFEGAAGRFINASKHGRVADCNGLQQFTVEFLVNCTDANASPTYILAACGGTIKDIVDANGNDLSGSFFSISRRGSAGSVFLLVTVTTSAATYTLQTAPGTDVALNTLQHVALTIDLRTGHQVITLWVEGVAVATASTGTGETTVMMPWYEMTFGIGTFPWYPEGDWTAALTCGVLTWYGPLRISDTVRYSAGFTPAPSTWVSDGNTRLLVNFDVANQPALTALPTQARATLAGWIVGRSGAANVPVWVELNTSTIQYGYELDIRGLTLHNPDGGALYMKSQQRFHIDKSVRISALNGIRTSWWSYTGKIAGLFQACGGASLTPTNAWSAEVTLGVGSQFVEIGEGTSSEFGRANFGVIQTFSDMTVKSCYRGSSLIANYLITGDAYSAHFIGSGLDGEEGIQTSCQIMASRAQTLHIEAGYITEAAVGVPLVRVGLVNHLKFETAYESTSAPIFSFGKKKNAGLVVECDSTDFGPSLNNLWDPAYPGPVAIPSRLQNGVGVHVVTSADVTAGFITLSQDEYSYGTIRIADPGFLLSGTMPVVVPGPFAGWRRTFFNDTAQTLTFGSTPLAVGPTPLIGLPCDYYPIVRGLAVNFDASKIGAAVTDGSPITTWTDLVGGLVGTAAGSVHGPVYRKAGAPNGRMPAVYFSSAFGTDCRVFGASGMPSSGTTRTVFTAAQHDAGGNPGGVLLQTNNGAGAFTNFMHYNPGGVPPWYVCGDASVNDSIAGGVSSSPVMYAHRLTSGAQASVRLNGVAQTITGAGVTGTFGAQFAIGNNYAGTAPLSAVLMQQTVHTVVLTDAECAAIENYINIRWY